jgi:hypothetical protein
MEETSLQKAPAIYPLLSSEERLKRLRDIQGIWQNGRRDPIEELEEMRKEWDRELPPFRR